MAAKKSSKKARSTAKKQQTKKVTRRPPVNGCVYTDGMSDAYWRGRKDGKDTAVTMINRAEPKNVRVRSLAVVAGGKAEQALSTDLPVTYLEQPENIQPETIALPDEPQERGLVSTKTKTDQPNNIAVMKNSEKTIATPEQAENTTYSLRKGEIISGNVRAVKPTYKIEGETVYLKPVESPQKEIKQSQSRKQTESQAGSFIQRWSEISFLRKLIMLLSVCVFLFAFSSLIVGVVTIGILPIALIGMFFFTLALFWNKIEACRSRAVNAALGIVAVIVVLGILCMAFVSGKMLSASMRYLPEDKTRVTVVVLGCRILGDEPSLMLGRRLDVAAEYLKTNPEAYCVVTGGQGENEDYAEATIMKRYLVREGISPSRIIAERKSTSTVENIENAKVLIEKYNCHEDIAIVSDRFHQYRAYLAARDAGLKSYAMPCETPWYLVAQYWFREMVGIYMIWFE